MTHCYYYLQICFLFLFCALAECKNFVLFESINQSTYFIAGTAHADRTKRDREIGRTHTTTSTLLLNY